MDVRPFCLFPLVTILLRKVLNMKTAILLVDDHPIFLKGLGSLLEDEADMRVIGEAGSGKECFRI